MASDFSLRDVLLSDPLLAVKCNDGQLRFIQANRGPATGTLTMVLNLKGNRAGGSYGLMSVWSAIMFGTRHKNFQGSPFGAAWPFRKSARIAAPIGSLGDRGPIQNAMRELFPQGKYMQSKGAGHGYFSQGRTSTGWDWDVITYDQTPLQAAGANKGLILMSEPPPKGMFVECVTRLSGNGMLIAEMTRLDLAEWVDDYVEAGGLMLDGKKVGEVRAVTADIEDSCAEHHNGHQAHSAIEATIAAWPPEEREARRTGKSLKLSGRIYTNWGEANELETIPDWHAKKWDEGQVIISTVLDPADRKPWAMAWFATYPNDDVIAFQEWPPFDYHACKSSPVTDIEDYRNAIIEAEAWLLKDLKEIKNRYIDPLFGNTPGKGNARTLRTMLSGPCRACLRKVGASEYQDVDERSEAYISAVRDCKHKLPYSNSLAYDGSIRDGHILVREAIGNSAQGERPKFYALKATCPNLCYGMRRYAYKENSQDHRGLSEKPQLVYKDFPDLPRLGYLKSIQKWPVETPPPPMPGKLQMFKPRFRPK